MNDALNIGLYYAAPTLLVVAIYTWLQRLRTHRNLAAREQSIAEGVHEPASLHPVIDPNLCLGCGTCVTACPEHNVLGLIHNKAELIAAANCVGHGACAAACPRQAITLVFGTETRGVDIPHINPNFETNVPGIFIAGELGGMGLIRNAVQQGTQAVASIRALVKEKHNCALDLVIVGAGPAGIAAALAAKEAKLKFTIIDQDSLGGTVAHFPRQKIVMTAPAKLPIIGEVNFRETTKETLLKFWEDVVAQQQLRIQFGERLDHIDAADFGFEVITTRNRYRARAILLCLGRRGTPRQLGVPGEELSKVVYRLIDPEQYRGQRVLVVGGGDSAIEAAVSIAEQENTEVTLSYRSNAFARVKAKNRERLEAMAANKRVRVLLSSQVKSISPDKVAIGINERTVELTNDAVIICAGGILPTQLLEKIGIAIETKFGVA
ncbi:MAG TPA: NAD(P)-binding domain-containing protein [Spongiibacteraceae bacterium]|nr:NAD(P)-binding domain-containing protein [Spongiibacteraceae bacterium]